ncbi:MAG: hypothetical protein IJR28_02550 [Ottowia sp.]|nr:hypothetical protein [Ottowia sp.]
MTAATAAATPAPAPVAGLLRRLADALPTMEGYTGEDAAALRQLAEAQQRKEEYDAWVRAKVARALADPRPSLSTEEVLARLDALCDELEAEERARKVKKAGRRAAHENVRRAVAA